MASGAGEWLNNSAGKMADVLPEREEEEGMSSCDILKTNNTLSTLMPGWEGIPTNMILNLIIAVILVLAFAILRWQAIKSEGQKDPAKKTVKGHSWTDWLHFIYGNKKTDENVVYTTKMVNRDHPNAYLPVVLHEYVSRIKAKVKDSSKDETGPSMKDLYIKSSIPVENSTGSKSLSKKEDSLKRANSKKKDPEIPNNLNEAPTMRTKSMTDRREAEEDLQIARLQSVLWNVDPESEETTTQSTDSTPSPTFAEWVSTHLLIKDKDILFKRGPDCLQYLLFQRYLIYFLICLTIICMCVILPTNLYGDKLGNREEVQYWRTTIINIKKSSNLIWIHTFMTLMIFIIGLYLMHNFQWICGHKATNLDRRILLIENIPASKRDIMTLKDFFAKKFPEVVIKRITFVYDINEIMSLTLSLWTAIEAKRFCIDYQKSYGQRYEVRPCCLGNLLGVCGCAWCCAYCCSSLAKKDGINYYTQEKRTLEKEIIKEQNAVVVQPQRMAFIVFQRQSMAEEVHDHFIRKHGHCYKASKFIQMLCGHEEDPVESWQWHVQYAPFPDDIQWDDIAAKKKKIWILDVTMNVLIIIIFLFFSTPTSAYRIVQYYVPKVNKTIQSEMNQEKSGPIQSLFWSYAPTIFLMIMTGLLPAVIKILTTQIPYKTKSDYNHAIMFKSYIFLVLMVLILPSLQIVTGYALFQSSIGMNRTGNVKKLELQCLFPAENGPFFLSYVMVSAFVGCAMELIRISELALYFLCLLFVSRSPAEYLTARQMTKFEFYFGTYYPRILLLFTLIVTFSISNPLIAPTGLFYMVVKHLLDRYHIYHLYVPSKINQRIHSKAVLFIYVSFLFLLFQVYTHLASMNSKLPSYIIGIVFVLHCLYVIFEFVLDVLQLS